MKKQFYFLFGIFSFLIFLNSCSKCYECSHVVYIETNGKIDSTTATNDYCTANDNEIKEKEKQGQTCVEK